MDIALTIAGSDSGGGAGIQADLKTFHQFGVFGTSVVVAVTAQNTCGVRAVHAIPSTIVDAQLEAVLDDLPPRAVKTGMLPSGLVIERVAGAAAAGALPNLVVDPVMVATSGQRLIDPDAVNALRRHLVPRARLITPNVPEAEVLSGHEIRTTDDLAAAAERLVELGAAAVLIKGSHLLGDGIVDLLVSPQGRETFTHARLDTTSTHGTGCTLSAAITALLATSHDLSDAVGRAIDFVHRAIAGAPGLGAGHGPLNHLTKP